MRIVLFIIFTLLFSLESKSQFSKIDSFCKNWLGTPYKFGGTDSTGIDCSGLTQKMASSVYNKDLPRTVRQQMKSVRKVSKDSLQKGDLLFFRTKQSPTGYHVGIFIEDGFFIHAASSKLGVIISHLNNRNILMIGRIIN